MTPTLGGRRIGVTCIYGDQYVRIPVSIRAWTAPPFTIPQSFSMQAAGDMSVLVNTHKLINSVLGVVGLQLERKPLWMPAAPVLPDRLLRDCRVLSSRQQLLAALPKHGNAAEVGVAFGDFTEDILSINSPKMLYLVDAWEGARYGSGFEHVNERFGSQIESGTMKLERGHSTTTLRNIPKKSLDWIYIDTKHDFTITREELAIAESLVKPDGHISGHDFCTGNPYRALPYGVIPAVAEFCVERNWALAYLTLDPNGHFSFCLRRT